MDVFANLVKNKESCTNRITVRKIYIDEDPNQEDEFPCPKCWEQQLQSVVRYMYVNLNEAIFKCQSASCMYPFRDFKYKNYTDKTVYFYRAVEAVSTEPAPDKINPAFPNLSSPCRTANTAPDTKSSPPVIDFGTSFFTPEKEKFCGSQELKSPNDFPGLDNSNIFDSPSLSFKSLAKEFDTGFIDDILLELGGSQSPEKKPILRDKVKTVSPVKPATTNRQLKRCLQMFQESKISDSQNDSIFKVPPVPGAEISVSPKHKPKKSPHRTRHKHSRRVHSLSTDHEYNRKLSPDKKLLKSRMRPMEFIETLNNMQNAPGATEAGGRSPQLPGIKRLGNQKVERMLNFIERSMKNRTSVIKVPPAGLSAPRTSTRTSRERAATTPRRKESRKLSLSAAVLQDTQFQYSTSEDEEFTPEAANASTSAAVKVELVEPVDRKPPLTSLPSFDDLLHMVQSAPTPQLAQPKLLSPNGFRSAGSSPKHVQQWDHTPPRRIHSMESLNSLLE